MKQLIMLYEKYIENLDEKIDDRELLAELKEYSFRSDIGKELYEKAVMAQLFFYEKETIEEMPRLLKSFNEKLAATRQTENIWSYLNGLLQAKGLTWSTVFNRLGKTTQLSAQMATGTLKLDRLPASVLSDIAKILDANFDKLCALAKHSLSSPQQAPQPAVHLRKSPQTPELPTNAQSANAKDDLACNQYLNELRKHLSNR